MKNKNKLGFSLLELLLAVALLLVISGAIFSLISNMQSRYLAEENRLTAVDSTREFVDQMVRDLHQNAFPHPRMFAPSFTGTQPYTNASIAAGMVVATPTQVQFEANLDGSASGVQVIVYRLTKNGALVTDLTQCPCVLQRGQQAKVNGVAPESQAGPPFTTEVDNVINPATEPLFRFFDQSGNELTGLPAFNSAASNGGGIAAVYTVKISVTVQGQTADPKTHLYPEVTYTATAQMNN
ncbi:MAG TPA: prepilin-type N-terminal cleavage/methylation domain-containing protein [Candidatus Angelobacter sp.]|nr:prepilin-type N-terminal cleavage/methylation domain-containing protein [Candidatus Angelobacter sp.]